LISLFNNLHAIKYVKNSGLTYFTEEKKCMPWNFTEEKGKENSINHHNIK